MILTDSYKAGIRNLVGVLYDVACGNRREDAFEGLPMDASTYTKAAILFDIIKNKLTEEYEDDYGDIKNISIKW